MQCPRTKGTRRPSMSISSEDPRGAAKSPGDRHDIDRLHGPARRATRHAVEAGKAVTALSSASRPAASDVAPDLGPITAVKTQRSRPFVAPSRYSAGPLLPYELCGRRKINLSQVFAGQAVGVRKSPITPGCSLHALRSGLLRSAARSAQSAHLRHLLSGPTRIQVPESFNPPSSPYRSTCSTGAPRSRDSGRDSSHVNSHVRDVWDQHDHARPLLIAKFKTARSSLGTSRRSRI